jgi:hypothetical protein
MFVSSPIIDVERVARRQRRLQQRHPSSPRLSQAADVWI